MAAVRTEARPEHAAVRYSLLTRTLSQYKVQGDRHTHEDVFDYTEGFLGLCRRPGPDLPFVRGTQLRPRDSARNRGTGSFHAAERARDRRRDAGWEGPVHSLPEPD